MDRKQIIHTVTKSLSRLKKFSNTASANFSKKAIHHFRVEYKKLRAFLRMLSHKNVTEKIKIPGTIKKTYVIAGALRDLQLQQQWLAEMSQQENKKPHPGKALLKKIKTLEKELCNNFSKNPVAGCKNKIISSLPATLPAGNYTLFIQDKLAENKSLLSKKSISDTQIHTVRKNLKDLFYNMQLLKNTQYQLFSQLILNGKNEKPVRQLLAALGNYQDKCVAIKLLNEYKPGKAIAYRKIKLQWTNEKYQQKRLLIKKMKDIFMP